MPLGRGIGPSTARGMGPAGTIQAARGFLAEVKLSRFEVTSEKAFIEELDKCTEELRRAMPPGARQWGSARKFLNIFLRGCVYNRHMCNHFKIAAVERWLEVPLDSHVAEGLRTRDGRMDLPKWRTVVGLSPEVSQIYQQAAAEIAAAQGVHRIHLDLRYWRRRGA